MFSAALRYPRRGEGATRTLLVGGALVLLGTFLVLPLLPVLGYYVRVLRGADPPPRFGDWRALTADGLKAVVVQVLYLLPIPVAGTLVFAVVGTFVFELGSGAPGTVARAGVVDLVLGILSVGIALGLLAALVLPVYLLPGALALFAREGRIAAAFDPGDLRRLLFSTDYLVGWLLAAVVFALGGIVGTALAVVLVGFVVQFYAGVAGYRLIAEAVSRALAA